MDTSDVVEMMMKAHKMEPDNKLYKWAIFSLPEYDRDMLPAIHTHKKFLKTRNL